MELGADDTGWRVGVCDRDLNAAAPQMCFHLRSSELPSMAPCLGAMSCLLCLVLLAVPSPHPGRGCRKSAEGAGQRGKGSWVPCPVLSQLTCPLVTRS